MIRFLLLLLFPLVANAATTWELDWENALSAANVRNPTDGYWWHGNCFAKSSGDLFNNVELSTKHVRTGSKSIRMFRHSLYPNVQGRNPCESAFRDTDRHRNQIRIGHGKGDGTFDNWDMGADRWFRFSFYLPSDEGNFNAWNSGEYAYKRIIIATWIGSVGSDYGRDFAFTLTGGPQMLVDGYYNTVTTPGAAEIYQEFGWINLKKDAWNDVIIRHRRSWQTAAENPTGHGLLKVWINCAKWDACTPAINYSGRTAMRNKTTGWWKLGPYGNTSTWDHQHVIYYDTIKQGIADTETEAQMLAIMADDYSGQGTGGGGGGGGGGTASDLNVNAGAAIDSEQDPIEFTVTGMNDITNCTMKGPTDSTPLAVKWDYAGLASGKFAGVDTTDWATSGTVTCYDETFIANPAINAISMSVTNTTTQNRADLDNWGYTSGRRISKSSSGNGNAFWTYGSSYSVVAGDNVRFDTTYSCSGDSCNYVYFDIPTMAGSKRIRVAGTAGSLARSATPEAEHGTSIVVRNYTMPDDTYRVVVSWVSDGAYSYKFTAGWLSGSAANLTMDLHEVVMRKNWTTRIIKDDVTYSVADSTAPILSNCSVNNVRNGEGSYTATLLCNADEIGGTDYAMITTSATVPSVADVKAATGAIWSSQKPATTTEISFEANGMSYQDLWGWIMRCDAADNCSTVAGVTFDDGLTPGQMKKIKFSSTTKMFKSGGSAFNGVIDEFTLYDTDPLRAPSAGRGNALVEFQSIGVGTGADPDLPAGTFELTAEDAVFGDLNALTLGTYYYTAYTFTGGVLKFSSGTIDLIAELGD